jgi:AraC-like DNA-binding protein
LILLKKKQKRASIYFGLLLLLMSLACIKIIFQETIPDFADRFPVPLLYKFAFGPLLYLFVKELFLEKTESSGRLALHFLPVLLFDILFRIGFPLLGFSNSDPIIQQINLYLLNTGSLVYNTTYLLFTIGLWFRFKKDRAEKPSIKTQRLLFYTKYILVLEVISTIAVIAFLWLSISQSSFIIGGIHTYYFNYLVTFFYIYYLSYMVYVLPEISILSPSTKVFKAEERPEDDRLKNLKEKIIQKQYFLDPDMNLQKLAELLQINPREFSEMINREEEMNFNDFLNSFRISHFKKLLLEQEKDYSVEGMALDSGFSSKTSFYRAFKKSTGLTPLQYQKEQKMSTKIGI